MLVALVAAGFVLGTAWMGSFHPTHCDQPQEPSGVVDTSAPSALSDECPASMSRAATCDCVTGDSPNFVCADLRVPAGVVGVTYNPREEHISRHVHGFGNYLTTVAQVLQREFEGERDLLMVDVGANIGMFTLSAAGLGHRVVAFEPGRDNAQHVRVAAVANGFLERVELHEMALGYEEGILQLFLNPDNAILKSDGIIVSGPDDPAIADFKTGNWVLHKTLMSTLDEFNANGRLTGAVAVKVDVEGFESLLVAGGRRFFSTVLPRFVFMELNWDLWVARRQVPGWMSMADTAAVFTDLGYKMYLLDQLARLELRGERPAEVTIATLPKDTPNPDVVFIRE